MGDDEAIRHFLSLQLEETARALTVVRKDELDPSRLLHISKDTSLKSFSPAVTRRSMADENRSVPRISTAPSLAGCILGYSSDLFDFIEQPTSTTADRKRKVEYRGGWAVYGFSFELCLKPSKELLPDVGRTDEHWLVTYSEDTVRYSPELLGKFYYELVSYVAAKEFPQVELVMVVELLTDTPIRFDHEVVLKKGFWRLQVKGLHNAEAWDKIPSVVCTSLSKQEYEASKTLVASMLSFEDTAPASSKW